MADKLVLRLFRKQKFQLWDKQKLYGKQNIQKCTSRGTFSCPVIRFRLLDYYTGPTVAVIPANVYLLFQLSRTFVV